MSRGFDLGEPAKKVHSFFEGFKAFALKGNVVDLAVGVIIGAAFSDIIKSLVDNVFMPIIGMIMPGGGVYENWQIGQIKIGLFIAAIVKFVIVAFILYVFIVKFIGWLMRAKETAPPPPTKSEELLMEIRDLLKAKPV